MVGDRMVGRPCTANRETDARTKTVFRLIEPKSRSRRSQSVRRSEEAE
jgi:hypothetical protein